jgi:3-deoxy-manno-octulosonate cytidylyltransferase (CMP-KDO synthetase)
MTFSVVIPARFGSTRLPGKPLLDLAGKPMILRVWEQAQASSAERVIIATDDERIADVALTFGAEVCMTNSDHPSGTDRLAEVARLNGFSDADIVVNVQGDEPLIPPAVIDQVADNLAASSEASIATLAEPITSMEELNNPNAVKVVYDINGMALYFSRAPIPWPRETFSADAQTLPASRAWARHIGIYAYRAGFLSRFVGWPTADIEALEQLEQLRALYQGERIHVAQACAEVPAGVDTEDDLASVRETLRRGDV